MAEDLTTLELLHDGLTRIEDKLDALVATVEQHDRDIRFTKLILQGVTYILSVTGIGFVFEWIRKHFS